MTEDKNHYFDIALVFCWLLISAIKIWLTQIVFFEHETILQFLISLLFWLLGATVIILAVYKKGIIVDFLTVALGVLLCCSIVNQMLLTFVFSLLVWYTIARLITVETFRICYLLIFLLLIVLILVTIQFTGQHHYIDGRYGSVNTFGFVNSNNFPQLLIILFLMFSDKLRWVTLLSLILILIFIDDIKTRTFYIILILYPLLLLLLRYGVPKIISLAMFGCFAASLLMVNYIDEYWIILLDKLLSYRISFSAQLLDSMQGFSDYLLGTKHKLTVPMDVSYIVVIFRYGIICALLLAWLYMKAISILIANKNYTQVALILCFLAYAFIENVLINYLLNPTLFYVFYALYDLGKDGSEKETFKQQNQNSQKQTTGILAAD